MELILNSSGASFRYGSGRQIVFRWRAPSHSIYLHDIRQRQELPSFQFPIETWVASRLGWVVASLLGDAHDAPLAFAEDCGTSVRVTPREAWWGSFGYITLRSDTIRVIAPASSSLG